ncbi:9944_t:CDS:1, partial [Funneliformis geosporum]
FISDHKHGVHSRRHNKKSKGLANKLCDYSIYLNFNIAENIVQSEAMRQVERDSHKIQLDKD